MADFRIKLVLIQDFAGRQTVIRHVVYILRYLFTSRDRRHICLLIIGLC